MRAIAPRYVRLSGEIADQAVLDSLKARFPGVPVGHAYASTEAGVGFEVTDGLEGFPAAYLDRDGPVQMKIVDGTLRIRSPRAASALCRRRAGAGGRRLGRYRRHDRAAWRALLFRGPHRRHHQCRRPEDKSGGSGGGDQPPCRRARQSRVSGRKSPITGAIVVAEVVLTDAANDNATFKDEILAAVPRRSCRRFKVPAMLRFVRQAGADRRRKAEPPCVTSWSPAAPAASAWPSPASWQATAFASSRWGARKATA